MNGLFLCPLVIPKAWGIFILPLLNGCIWQLIYSCWRKEHKTTWSWSSSVVVMEIDTLVSQFVPLIPTNVNSMSGCYNNPEQMSVYIKLQLKNSDSKFIEQLHLVPNTIYGDKDTYSTGCTSYVHQLQLHWVVNVTSMQLTLKNFLEKPLLYLWSPTTCGCHKWLLKGFWWLTSCNRLLEVKVNPLFGGV